MLLLCKELLSGKCFSTLSGKIDTLFWSYFSLHNIIIVGHVANKCSRFTKQLSGMHPGVLRILAFLTATVQMVTVIYLWYNQNLKTKIRDVFHRKCSLWVGQLGTRILVAKRLCGSEMIRYHFWRKVCLGLSHTAILSVVLEISGHHMTGGWEMIL